MQLELFDTTYREPVRLEELFAAYYDCRRHKRKTFNALEFEADFEQKLVNLWRAVNEQTYYPGRSIAFIVNKPVKREIFAADFQDRVIHHLVYQGQLQLPRRKRHALRHQKGGGVYSRLFRKLQQRLLYSEDGYSVFFYEH